MSINDYWLAKIEATEAGGVDPNANTPAETVIPEVPEKAPVEAPEPEEKPDPNEGLPAETVPEGAVPWGTPSWEQDKDDPNDGLPAETVDPDAEEPEDDADEVEFVEAPEDGDQVDPDAPDAERDAEFEADKAAATAEVPTQASNKETIKNYLIYQHGIDPDDLQTQTKAELLALVEDLAE